MTNIQAFQRFIGIDYSGAATPQSRLGGLQVFETDGSHAPQRVSSPASLSKKRRNWNREEVAEHLVQRALSGENFIAGIDHGLSFPKSYFEKYSLTSWDAFLADFVVNWPTDKEGVTVDSVRKQYGGPGRIGSNKDLRLTEQWTSSAKSVFLFDVQGSVAKSTHAGLPWLNQVRKRAGDRIHIWPFDGWYLPADKCVIAEVYPSLFRRRYEADGRTADEQDAYAVSRWLAEACADESIAQYVRPPLRPDQRTVAELEGWILGVM